jgi:16S rRNA (uracil1498-N3)-methyltransferase
MRRFYCEKPVVDSRAVLAGPDANHIKNVLRLNPGDNIELFDGKGLEFVAKIVSLSPRRVEVSVLRKTISCAEPPVQIVVAQSFLKEKKMDILVKQLTELGVVGWIPFFSERSVPRPDKDRLAARKKRWEKIATESLKQCGRGRIMEIGTAVSFETILGIGEAFDLKVAFWENEIAPISPTLTGEGNRPENIFVLIGPEGGFSKQEIESIRASGFLTATLGPRILKAETATVAACSLLQYLYGDMG